jgi:2',3'-cyclic-nucleotide 2'-phosphodiesterase
MKILFLGQLIGKHSITFAKQHLSDLKKIHAVDVVIAPGDMVSGGYGLGKNHALYMRKLGVDMLVGGELLFTKKDLVEDLDNLSFVVRPANFTGHGNFGYGVRHFRVGESGTQLKVINVMGQMGSTRVHAGNPYHCVDKMLAYRESPFTVVTFSAIASAEKQTMGHYLADKCSATIGYGAKALTYDAQIIKNSAYITDIGRIGSQFSIGGLSVEHEIKRYQAQRPRRNVEGEPSAIELQAVLVTLDDTGKATEIKALREVYPAA